MIVLVIAKNVAQFSPFVAELQRQPGIELLSAASGTTGFSLQKDKHIDLAIVDEQLDDMTGIAFVKQLVKINPLINTAIVSALADEDFHEATEGLGVLMQLPTKPNAEDAEALLAILKKIGALLQPVAPQAQKAVKP